MSIAYKNALIYLNLTISAGQNNSLPISCIVTSEGAVAPRRLIFPSGWTTSTVFFDFSEASDFSNFTRLYYFSNGDNTAFGLPNCSANSSIPLPAPYFDSVAYMRITSQNAQASNSTVVVACQPIYQVPA